VATDHQKQQFLIRLKDYKRRYLKSQFSSLDESATRIMVNSLLTSVLGYAELDEIKTEYNIKNEYADYVVQIQRKKHFVVEVKSIQIDLNERHLRQSLSYAANEGIDWILLTNARQIQIYRVLFKKPIEVRLVADFNFLNATPSELKRFSEILISFTRSAIIKGETEYLWQCQSALRLENVARVLYSNDTLKLLRKALKADTGITFGLDELADILRSAITLPVSLGERPRLK
jgi:hypothetical protein